MVDNGSFGYGVIMPFIPTTHGEPFLESADLGPGGTGKGKKLDISVVKLNNYFAGLDI